MTKKKSSIGLVNNKYNVIKLKDILGKNDSGNWGNNPSNVSYGVIRSVNFTNTGELVLNNVAKRSYLKERFQKIKLFKNDIIIERSGGSDNQPVGRVGFINKDIENKNLGFANFIQRIAVNEYDFYPKYIFYCLYRIYDMGITNSMQKQTTGIRNLEYKYFLKSKLPKPNKSTQKKIAMILSIVDKNIEQTKKTIEKAERLKKSMMQNLLTGKIKPDGTKRREEDYCFDDKYGKVPVGWKVYKLKEIIKLKNGKGNTTNNLKKNIDDKYYIPVYGGNGITGYFYLPLLEETTLIIGRVGEYCGSVYKTPSECWVTDNALYVSEFLIENYDIDLLKYILIKANFNHYSDSTGQPKITQSGIGNIRVIIPIKKIEQIKIGRKLNFIQDFLNHKEIKIQKLGSLKKSLMQNLLTGKIEVN